MNGSSAPSDSDVLCAWLASTLAEPFGIVLHCAQIALSIAIFALMAMVMCKFVRSNIHFHRNLLLLVSSVLFVCAIFAMSLVCMATRNLVLLLLYPASSFSANLNANLNSTNTTQFSPNPPNVPSTEYNLTECPLLVPVWLSIALRLPTYQHLFAYPLFHFAIMLERWRATKYASTYEQEGNGFGATICAFLWLLVVVFSLWMVFTSLADPSFAFPQLICTMISQYNADIVLYVHYTLLVVVALTATCDYALMVKNRRMEATRKNANPAEHFYNLGKAYQLNENAVSMRLFFPLDTAYTATFSLYLLASAWMRTKLVVSHEISWLQFMNLYELNTCLLPLHILLTLCVYHRFICGRIRQAQKAPVKIVSAEEQRKLYNDHLRKQWAS